LVKDLIVELQKHDPEIVVVMSKDGEGNDFSPLSDLSPGFYEAESTWSGEYIAEEYMEEYGYSKDDLPRCLVAWPIN